MRIKEEGELSDDIKKSRHVVEMEGLMGVIVAWF